jgi:hypothetical protein
MRIAGGEGRLANDKKQDLKGIQHLSRNLPVQISHGDEEARFELRIVGWPTDEFSDEVVGTGGEFKTESRFFRGNG